MQQIIYQNDRTVKGFDGAHLIFQGRIKREVLNGELFDISVIHLLTVQRFGHCVGHHHTAQDFAKGHTHIFAQFAHRQRFIGHMVGPRDLLQHFVMHNPCVYR